MCLVEQMLVDRQAGIGCHSEVRDAIHAEYRYSRFSVFRYASLRFEAACYNRFDSTEQILSKFDRLEKNLVSAINNKETYLGSDIDTIKKMIIQDYSKGGTRTKVKSKYPTRR